MRQLYILLILGLFIGCESNQKEMTKILFLHHSTGNAIWRGNANKYLYKLTKTGDVQRFFNKYNRKHNTHYEITKREFPQRAPYGWNNYPFDYYNIWVKNAGVNPFMEEPTLEILSGEYDVIVFKHCFPVSNIQDDLDSSSVDADHKSVAVYKLQYNALKDKLHQFPDVKFIVWTGAAQVKSQISEAEAVRAKTFFTWVTDEWDIPGDNIFIWDFYNIQTKGDLYFSDEYAGSINNSHPNGRFAGYAAGLFGKRIVDVIENDGLKTKLTGE